MTALPQSLETELHRLARTLPPTASVDPVRQWIRDEKLMRRNTWHCAGADAADCDADALAAIASGAIAPNSTAAAPAAATTATTATAATTTAVAAAAVQYNAAVNAAVALAEATRNAALHPHTAIPWRHLIDMRSTTTAATLRNETALTMAIRRGHLELVRLLLTEGASPNRMGNNQTPLYHCVFGRTANTDILSELLRAGARPNAPCGGAPYSRTVVFVVAEKDHLAALVELLQHGADLFARDTLGNTPLHHAVYCAKSAVAQNMYEAGYKDRDDLLDLTLCDGTHRTVFDMLQPRFAKQPQWAWLVEAKQRAVRRREEQNRAASRGVATHSWASSSMNTLAVMALSLAAAFAIRRLAARLYI